MSIRQFYTHTILLLSIIFGSDLLADTETDIKFILSAEHPPIGVVFEIIQSRKEDLIEALKQVETYSKRLKSSIPDIKLAVVSHGTEQFALLNANKKTYEGTHKKVQSLLADNVPIHICGTHASWYQYTNKDFPAYVNVAVAGPAKIREYQREGYALIVIE